MTMRPYAFIVYEKWFFSENWGIPSGRYVTLKTVLFYAGNQRGDSLAQTV